MDPLVQPQFAAYTRTEEPYFSRLAAQPPPKAAAQTVTHRLLVDNRDRPDPANTNPFDFAIHLSQTAVGRYENVTSVELKGVAFPKVAGEPYVIIDVDSFSDNLDATSDAAHRTFAVAYFDSSDLAPGAIKPVKGYDFYQKTVTFTPPLAVLDRLAVAFRTHDGNVVTADATANVTHASMLLEVTTGVFRS